MVKQCVDGLFITVHDVKDPFRQTGFGQQFRDPHHDAGIFFGRLQNERVSAGNRHGIHPQRHHRRKVERGDTGDYTNRLAYRKAVDVCRHGFRIFAFQKLWDTAGKFDNFDPSRNFAFGVGNGFTVLGRQQHSQFLGVAFQQVPKLKHHKRTFGGWRCGPGRQRLCGGLHDGIDVLSRSQTDRSRDGASRRIDDIRCAITRS